MHHRARTMRILGGALVALLLWTPTAVVACGLQCLRGDAARFTHAATGPADSGMPTHCHRQTEQTSDPAPADDTRAPSHPGDLGCLCAVDEWGVADRISADRAPETPAPIAPVGHVGPSARTALARLGSGAPPGPRDPPFRDRNQPLLI